MIIRLAGAVSKEKSRRISSPIETSQALPLPPLHYGMLCDPFHFGGTLTGMLRDASQRPVRSLLRESSVERNAVSEGSLDPNNEEQKLCDPPDMGFLGAVGAIMPQVAEVYAQQTELFRGIRLK